MTTMATINRVESGMQPMFRRVLPSRIYGEVEAIQAKIKSNIALAAPIQIQWLPDEYDDCWIWQGAKTHRDDKLDYGIIYLHGRSQLAHRIAYKAFKGDIPFEYTIDHLCRVASCVNPDHLEAITLEENLRRSNGVGAINFGKTHCIHGHRFEPTNTYNRTRENGGRDCRVCINNRARDYRKRLKQKFLI